MPNNYSSWSIDKLNKEVQKIQKVIAAKESRDKKATLAKLVSVARKSGFELHELVDVEAPKKARTVRAKPAAKGKKRGKVLPKYRNPSNGKETWTGRGRQPVWVRNLIASGGSLDDVTING